LRKEKREVRKLGGYKRRKKGEQVLELRNPLMGLL